MCSSPTVPPNTSAGTQPGSGAGSTCSFIRVHTGYTDYPMRAATVVEAASRRSFDASSVCHAFLSHDPAMTSAYAPILSAQSFNDARGTFFSGEGLEGRHCSGNKACPLVWDDFQATRRRFRAAADLALLCLRVDTILTLPAPPI
eukprot:Rmarinus@m.8447